VRGSEEEQRGRGVKDFAVCVFIYLGGFVRRIDFIEARAV
jgi:hypothetical protein